MEQAAGPTQYDDRQATFRVRIFDENQTLHFLAHRGDEKDEPGWEVIPVRAPTRRVSITPGDPTVGNIEARGV